jgi:hypothetical protein
MENALDQVVKPHTGKAVEQSVIAPLPARLTPLEMGTPEGQRLHARIETARLAQRYAQFDPSAMAQTYEDEKLGLTLPTLSAFRVDDKTPSRSVFFFSQGGAENLPSSLKNGKRAFEPGSWDAASDLNDHAGKVWAALRPKGFGRIGRILERAGYTGLGIFILSVATLIGLMALAPFYPDTMIQGGMAMVYGSLAIVGVIIGCTMLFGCAMAHHLYNPKAPCYTVTFGGFIPDSARAKIEAARPDFDDILLVCDVSNTWSVDDVSRSVNLDPLVVGVKEIGDKKHYFLIDRFNLTKLEDYVTAEGATSPKVA